MASTRVVPYGYRLEPVPQEQEIIKLVRGGGKLSLRTIATVLAEHGLVSRSGKQFDMRQLARMLEKPASTADR